VSEEIPALGRRLDGEGRRMSTRSVPARPWAAPFEVLVDHLAALPGPDDGRFARREAPVAESAWPAGESAGHDEPAPPGRALPSDVAARLRSVVGPGAEAMRVHDDDAAHETAVAHRADAVTIGQDVYFRQGRFTPHEPRGFGLLVHEATHVVERTRPGASWRQATGEATAAEETLALAREAAVVAGGTPAPRAWSAPHPGDGFAVSPGVAPRGVPAMPGHSPGAHPSFPSLPSFTGAGPPGAAMAPVPAAAPVATPAARPMTAAIDRPTEPQPAAQQPFDVDALRERILRDLKRQLRDEYERGG
jgi:hypothetical protein